jgi:hypothetical protein
MAYELKSLARQKVLYDNANATNPLVYQLVVNGVKTTPTSATITIYRRGVSTALVSAAAMTVSGTKLTYALSTTPEASWPIETGYRAELAITVGADVHRRHFVFDGVRLLLDLSIGVDQLVDIDDRVAGMVHNGDDDMPGLIVAARADLQARLESKVLGDGKMIENAILDPSHLSVAACYAILGQLWFDKGEMDRSNWYMDRYEKLTTAVLSNLRYDDAQNGEEDPESGGIQQVRLIT